MYYVKGFISKKINGIEYKVSFEGIVKASQVDGFVDRVLIQGYFVERKNLSIFTKISSGTPNLNLDKVLNPPANKATTPTTVISFEYKVAGIMREYSEKYLKLYNRIISGRYVNPTTDVLEDITEKIKAIREEGRSLANAGLLKQAMLKALLIERTYIDEINKLSKAKTMKQYLKSLA